MSVTPLLIYDLALFFIAMWTCPDNRFWSSRVSRGFNPGEHEEDETNQYAD